MKKTNPLIETIIETISKRILSGEYPGGYKLSENSISQEFDCSRTPVREAFKALEQNSLVQIIAHSGTYVKTFSDKENREITEIRAYLESLAFRLAAEQQADTNRLQTHLVEMEESLTCENPDFTRYGKAHYQFHQEIVRLSDNALLISMYENLHLNSATVLIYKTMNGDEIRSTIEEHALIYTYLKYHDAERGAEFMMNHLWKKRDRLLEAETAKQE